MYQAQQYYFDTAEVEAWLSEQELHMMNEEKGKVCVRLYESCWAFLIKKTTNKLLIICFKITACNLLSSGNHFLILTTLIKVSAKETSACLTKV